MIAVDTNIMVYAHREEMPLHQQAKARLVQLAENGSPWGLPVFCLGEFVRVVTHPRIFTPPSSLVDALGFLEALMKSPTMRLLVADGDYAGAFVELTRKARASGNLAFDAQIAAVCLVHGATLLTADRDFARFGIGVLDFSD